MKPEITRARGSSASFVIAVAGLLTAAEAVHSAARVIEIARDRWILLALAAALVAITAIRARPAKALDSTRAMLRAGGLFLVCTAFVVSPAAGSPIAARSVWALLAVGLATFAAGIGAGIADALRTTRRIARGEYVVRATASRAEGTRTPSAYSLVPRLAMNAVLTRGEDPPSIPFREGDRAMREPIALVPRRHAIALALTFAALWIGATAVGAVGAVHTIRTARATWDARPSHLAVGGSTSCVADFGGTVRCRGGNAFGELGVAGPDAADYVTLPLRDIVEISLGEHFGCARDRAGAVWCWGANEAGQCGSPGGASAPVTRVPRMTGASRIAAGESSACAIDASGHLSCWGSLASILDATARAHRFIDVAVSSRHVCAVDDRGVPWCWGTSEHGTPVAGVDHATTIAAGYAHTCVLRSDRSVWCWGRMGDEDVAPRALEELHGSVQLAAAGGGVCGLLSEGNARCVGRTTSPFANRQTPAARRHDVAEIAMSPWSVCVRGEDDSLRCYSEPDSPLGLAPVESREACPDDFLAACLCNDGTIGYAQCERTGERRACLCEKETNHPPSEPHPDARPAPARPSPLCSIRTTARALFWPGDRRVEFDYANTVQNAQPQRIGTRFEVLTVESILVAGSRIFRVHDLDHDVTGFASFATRDVSANCPWHESLDPRMFSRYVQPERTPEVVRGAAAPTIEEALGPGAEIGSVVATLDLDGDDREDELVRVCIDVDLDSPGGCPADECVAVLHRADGWLATYIADCRERDHSSAGFGDPIRGANGGFAVLTSGGGYDMHTWDATTLYAPDRDGLFRSVYSIHDEDSTDSYRFQALTNGDLRVLAINGRRWRIGWNATHDRLVRR